ncbi:hypothetical protein L1987_77859 [Smallanthus sonchifolius]|uniref:Uncharacterized protein n=1 Tax=Smallanthus sonchifolius TaxID=185202 RepID=A0ACB8ZC31_9ASTR|nr:hypothetical protein L1987_77859 [Smallanthus sonchifolius]
MSGYHHLFLLIFPLYQPLIVSNWFIRRGSVVDMQFSSGDYGMEVEFVEADCAFSHGLPMFEQSSCREVTNRLSNHSNHRAVFPLEQQQIRRLVSISIVLFHCLSIHKGAISLLSFSTNLVPWIQVSRSRSLLLMVKLAAFLLVVMM